MDTGNAELHHTSKLKLCATCVRQSQVTMATMSNMHFTIQHCSTKAIHKHNAANINCWYSYLLLLGDFLSHLTQANVSITCEKKTELTHIML